MHNASLLHHLVANLLDFLELVWFYWLIVREIESQLVFGDKGAFLIYLLPKNLTKRKIQDVCCRVVLCHKRSPSVVNLGAAMPEAS